MEVFYKVFEVQIKRKNPEQEIDSYETYKFRSTTVYELDRVFDSELSAQLAIEKYGEPCVNYIIQKWYQTNY